jgi:type IV pilus assembly protein PilX
MNTFVPHQNRHPRYPGRPSGYRGAPAGGIVLILVLLVMVAMTLAGMAVMRSTFTSNRVAANLAFRQAAVHSADAGLWAAADWLQANKGGTTLHANIDQSATTTGYFAQRGEPSGTDSWHQYWEGTLSTSGRVNTLASDDAGNTVKYVIQRLCTATGAPTSGACEASPNAPGQWYYRITVRVEGPRNTRSYVQAVMAL